MLHIGVAILLFLECNLPELMVMLFMIVFFWKMFILNLRRKEAEVLPIIIV
jgi:hypothetical protein